MPQMKPKLPHLKPKTTGLCAAKPRCFSRELRDAAQEDYSQAQGGNSVPALDWTMSNEINGTPPELQDNI